MEQTPEEIKRAALENVEKVAKAAVTDQIAEEVNKSLESVNKSVEDLQAELTSKSAELDEKIGQVSASLKKINQTSETQKKVNTFNQYLEEAIKENAESIKGFKKGSPELSITMKAVGDMSIANNFPGATPFIQDVRQGLIMNPMERTWLADILPQGTSDGNSIIYPVESGQEGAVAPWVNQAADKAQVDFDLASKSAFFKWIAGYVIVDREMLDDIKWLTSYLQNKLLLSLKTAENAFILNGTTDTNPVTGLLTAATVYNGTLDGSVDRVIDAGWGQIVEETFDFYNPTHTILNPRSAVGIGLNKASGSGEYDLPAGSMAFANGKLQIGGLDVVTTTSINKTDFLTFDRNATTFVQRLSPELRMFEDAALAKRNKIMFRIEERVTLAIFNNKAIVKGPLVAPAG